MANVGINELLSMLTVTGVISRIKMPQDRFQRFWGMNMGGPNIRPVPGKLVAWDILDYSRNIATARAPGAGPATITPKKIGQAAAQLMRVHEKIHLIEEQIYRTRPLGSNSTAVDEAGQSYVSAQARYLAERVANMREFLVSRMCRGGFAIAFVGDDWVVGDLGMSGAVMNISFQIPAGNLNDLQFGTGSSLVSNWTNTSTGTPISDALKINAVYERTHGYPIQHVWLSTATMLKVLKTDEVKNLAGSSQTPFAQLIQTPGSSDDGVPNASLELRLTGLPFLQWHVYDAVLNVNGSETAFLPADKAMFLPEPSRRIAEMAEGSEIVAENVMDPGKTVQGFTAWTQRTVQPAGWDLIALDNALPLLYMPNAVAYGTVAS